MTFHFHPHRSYRFCNINIKKNIAYTKNVTNNDISYGNFIIIMRYSDKMCIYISYYSFVYLFRLGINK